MFHFTPSSSSSDDLPVPLALPVYSSVPPGLGWCAERPLSIYRRGGFSILWSVWPPTRRELRGPGHKHHLPVSTSQNPNSRCACTLFSLNVKFPVFCKAEFVFTSCDEYCIYTAGRAITGQRAIEHFQLKAQQCFLCCIFFPDHITARSWVLSLETRPCVGNGYFCSVRLVLIWRECNFLVRQVRPVMVHITLGLISSQTALGWSELPWLDHCPCWFWPLSLSRAQCVPLLFQQWR